MQQLINEALKKNHLPIEPEKLWSLFEEKLKEDGDFSREEMNLVAGLALDSELVATEAIKMREAHFRSQGKKAPEWPELEHEKAV